MIKQTLSATLVLANIALSPVPAHAIATQFEGGTILATGNVPALNGCCGDITFNISFTNVSPYGEVILSNFNRTFLLYINPIWFNPNGIGTFHMSIALADWLGQWDNGNCDGCSGGNGLIVQTPDFWAPGLGNAYQFNLHYDTANRYAYGYINAHTST